MYFKQIAVSTLASLGILACLMMAWIVTHPYEGSFTGRGSIFDGKIEAPAIPPSDKRIFSNEFSYSAYRTDLPTKGFIAFEEDIQRLDSLYPSMADAGQQLLYTALADSLEPTMSTLFQTYQPDSMLLLLEWVIPFREYAKISPPHALVYNAVHSYWMNKTALALSHFAEESSDLPYQFKFQYLTELCARNTFHVNIQETNLEKFKKNLLAGNWNHLISASWNDSPTWGKLLFIALFLLTTSAYLILIQRFFKLFKNDSNV